LVIRNRINIIDGFQKAENKFYRAGKSNKVCYTFGSNSWKTWVGKPKIMSQEGIGCSLNANSIENI